MLEEFYVQFDSTPLKQEKTHKFKTITFVLNL